MAEHIAGAFESSDYAKTKQRNFILFCGVVGIILLVVMVAVKRVTNHSILGPASASAAIVSTGPVSDSIKMVDVMVPVQRINAGSALEPAMFRLEKRPQIEASGRLVNSFEVLKGQYARAMIPP